MDDLLDWSEASCGKRKVTHPLPASRTSSSPHLDSPAPATSPAGRSATLLDEQEAGNVILDFDGPGEGKGERVEELEWEEDEGGSEDEEAEARVELPGYESEDEEDGLPGLSFSSRSNSPSSTLEPTTPPNFNDFALDFSQPDNAGEAEEQYLLNESKERLSKPSLRRSPSPVFFSSPLPDRSPSPVALSPNRTDSPSPRYTSPKRCRNRTPSPSRSNDVLPPRAASPTQAEMDAFFGFTPLLPTQPLRAPLPPAPRAPSSVRSPQRGQSSLFDLDEGKTDEEPAAAPSVSMQHVAKRRKVPEKKDKPQEREYYQLQPIPTHSAETGEPLSVEEKRTAIMTSLQRLALSSLSQITDNTVPPPSSSSSSSTSDAPALVSPQTIKVQLVRRSRNDGDDGTASKKQTITFPRKCEQGDDLRLGGRELASLLKAIELIVEGLIKDVVSTKRDLYYRDVALFKKQQNLDSIIEDLAATLHVRRNDLNVVAAAKGLFAGSLQIVTTDDNELVGQLHGALIPPAQTIDRVETDEVKWVLVVEKEAVFQSLCSSGITEDETIGNGVLLTGKGYPDLATRELVKRFADDLPSVPIVVLVDSDPHGLEILSTYRFGSAALSFDSAYLTVDRVQWLGVRGTEWDTLGVDRVELLPLTRADRLKAVSMLKREWLPSEWRRELQYMLHLGRKAEIQAISSSSSSPSQQAQGSSSSTSSSDSQLVEYIKSKIAAVLARTEQEGMEEKDRVETDS